MTYIYFITFHDMKCLQINISGCPFSYSAFNSTKFRICDRLVSDVFAFGTLFIVKNRISKSLVQLCAYFTLYCSTQC